MTLAVEPILNAGSKDCRTLKDRWTVVTVVGAYSAQWEHTIAVTSDGDSKKPEAYTAPGL
jgi:methionyl aminopeptidase